MYNVRVRATRVIYTIIVSGCSSLIPWAKHGWVGGGKKAEQWAKLFRLSVHMYYYPHFKGPLHTASNRKLGKGLE